ncbi:MAG: peroxiredoxin-like family protein [Bdellovibrionales bacterium]
MISQMHFLKTLILLLLFIGCSSAHKNVDTKSDPHPVLELPLTAEAVKPILVGSQTPNVKLRDTSGEVVELSQLLSGKPALLIFYRGGWCPYCNLQLGALQKIEKDIQKLGVQIIAISPDRPEELSKSTGKHKLNYTLVSDSDMVAAKAFGIAFRVDDETVEKYKGYKIDLEASSGQTHHGLPVPSLFAISREGLITFTYVNPNYKVRPSSEVVLAIARDISKQAK